MCLFKKDYVRNCIVSSMAVRNTFTFLSKLLTKFNIVVTKLEKNAYFKHWRYSVDKALFPRRQTVCGLREDEMKFECIFLCEANHL